MSLTTMKCSRWFGPGDLHPIEKDCPFCGSVDRVPVARLQEEPAILLLRCGACAAVSANPLPKDDVLRKHYENYARVYASYSAHRRVTFSRVAGLSARVMRQTGDLRKVPRIRILDFGGGDGSLGLALARRFLAGDTESATVSIVDYNASRPDTCDPRVRIDVFRTLVDAGREPCDLVLASAILEHLPHPGRDFDVLASLVKPGGYLYARTPFVLPVARVASRLGRQLDFSYPSHLHDLGSDFWRAAFSRAPLSPCFRRIASRPSPVETSLGRHFFTALASYAAKAPWYVLGDRYRLVGGWEIVAQREESPALTRAGKCGFRCAESCATIPRLADRRPAEQ